MGGPFEGQPGPITFRDHQEWRISDDTQLTLATCESIIELDGSISPEHIAGRFVQWFRERRITGMGSSTLKALRDLDAGLHWALDAVLRNAIEAGDDTNTVASITGQIAGAWIGANQIPRALIDSLPHAQSSERIAGEFALTLQST